MIEQAWAEKWRPKTINDLIFPNETVANAINKWYQQGYIDSNILLYGRPGTGKSSLLKILANDFIKNEKDLFVLGRKVEDIEKLGRWINSAAVASPCRIVAVEEADRLSAAATLVLKERYMERYLQQKTVFIATTNNPHKIDPAIKTRYNLKINFDDLPIEQVMQRVQFILQQEGVSADPAQLHDFVSKHARKGMRELLNLLQVASVTGTFNPDAIGHLASVTDEGQLIPVIEYLIKWMLAAQPELTQVLAKYPTTATYYEQFGKYYDHIVTTLQNYIDFDYVYVMQELLESKDIPLDIKNIIINYMQDIDFKIYKNLHFIAMIGEILSNIDELKRTT